ncbi:MAG: hypothetical protein KAR20_04315, partial [Candidatus Heimdallarchaeota archaeon]|nr:hypothetical protein [Candidatus Heimdallarchaeota archaeon]
NTSGDTVSVISSASVTTFDNRDLENPVVKDISITPDPQIINLPVDITVNVTDNQNVSIVRAQITYPNSSLENLTMTDDDNDDVYNLTFTSTAEDGIYNVTFIGIDVDNNINNTEKSNFTIQLDALSLTTDKENYVANEIVYIIGKGFHAFVNVTVNITDPTEDSVLNTKVVSNSTGGINLTWTVPSTPTLGTYIMGANDTTDYSRSVSGSFEVVSAIIESDKSSYEQGETVYITGSSWDPDVNVTVNITDPNAITVYGPVNITSNSTGHINSTWFIPYNQILGNHLLSGFEPDTPAKNDDYTFTVTARTVVINTQFSWYKTGEQVNITGYGFSPLVNVTIDIYNSTDQSITGYPKDVISNSTGGINDTFTVNNLPEGIYTILVNDTVYPNLGTTNTFDIVIAEMSTDKENYNNGETITIIGKYWDRLVNVTIDVINETS